MGRVTARRPVYRVGPAGVTRRPDTLAVEEPLEIRVDGVSLTVTMRTPGDDIDLVHGFLLAEGIVAEADDIATVRYCDGVDESGANTYNVLDVTLRTQVPVRPRSLVTSSSCGVCGKATLDQVEVSSRHPIPPPGRPVGVAVLSKLPALLRERQRVFDSTGGLHAAGLFTDDGTELIVREDVGRHNAVDKVIGWAVRERRVPLSDVILMVSGRASFELVQKAVLAGVPMLGAVSAPSSLAVDLADRSGLTLVGFLRGETMNVYTAPERIALPDDR